MSPAREASEPAVSMARATSFWSASSKTRAISPARADMRPATSSPRGEKRARRGSARAASTPSASLEGLGDVFDARQQRARRLFGAFGDAPVGVGKGVAGLLVQDGGDFQHLVAQRAGNDHGALFENLTDVVDAEVDSARSMVPVRSSMTPVWRRNASSIFSTSAATACEMSTRLPAIVSMWPAIGAIDFAPRLGELAEILVERLGQRVAPVGEPADVAGDDVVEDCAALGDLLQVGLQRLRQGLAAFGDLLDLGGDQLVDIASRASASFSRSASSARVRMSRPWASFSTWPATRPSMPLRLSASLFEVVLERLGEHGRGLRRTSAPVR